MNLPTLTLAPIPQLRIKVVVAPPDEFWKEITDPVNFIVGALILTRHHWRSLETYLRLTAAFWVLAVVVAPAISVAWSSKLGLGDPLWYGLTLLGVGAIALVPGRIRDLRDAKKIPEVQHPCVPGDQYPHKLRIVLYLLEALALAVAIVLIARWGMGESNGLHHHVLRGVVWASGAACAADLFTGSACLNVVEWTSQVNTVRALLKTRYRLRAQ